jgi:hypothetical protein
MTSKNPLNLGLLATIGASTVIILLLLLVGAHAGFLFVQNREIDKKWDQTPNLQLQNLRADQQKRLQTPENSGLPIDQATKLVIEKKGNLASK